MTGATLFSGIGAPETAAPKIFWRFAAEIDKFASAVGAFRHPGIPNLGDITHEDFTKRTRGFGPIDVVVAGSPCQDFSVAGQRAGMDGDRGKLALRFLEVVAGVRPRWLLFENVPGILSSRKGRDFAAFLGALAKLGYGFASRVLDAQYFGVPQRRRRVFVVGHLGDWRRATAVLFERGCLSGDTAPGREERQEIAGKLGGGAGERGWREDTDRMKFLPAVAYGLNGKGGTGRMDAQANENFIAVPILEAGARTGKFTTDVRAGIGIGEPGDPMYTLQGGKQHAVGVIVGPLTACGGTTRKHGYGSGQQEVEAGHVIPVAFSCKDHGADAGDTSPTLRAMGHSGSHPNAGGQVAVAFQEAQTGVREYATAGTLRSNGPGHDPVGTRIRSGMAVRRLTPRECERLQGFEDDYTLIPVKRVRQGRLDSPKSYRYREIDGEAWLMAADGPRYKALGNSMAVPVMRWILRRIMAVDAGRAI